MRTPSRIRRHEVKREAEANARFYQTAEDRVFICSMGTCISYADREIEERGDYKTLARLFFDTLTLWIAPDCPDGLRNYICDDAAKYKVGDVFHCSATQTITLGHALKEGATRPT